MLNAGIIISEQSTPDFIHCLQKIQGVEWNGLYAPENLKNQHLEKVLIFSSPEILPKITDLLIILDPEFCNFEYLGSAVRNGCHLFLTEKLKLNLEQRKWLIHLAKEGNTYIEVRNSFMVQPLRKKKIIPEKNGTCFIEITDSASFETGKLEKRLTDNLCLILAASGAPVQRFDVFCGSVPILRPDIIHIHIKFINGSTASLKIIFNESESIHEMKIYDERGFSRFDLLLNHELNRGKENFLLAEQIENFIGRIQNRIPPLFGLTEEIEIYLLMKQIREKFDLHSVMY